MPKVWCAAIECEYNKNNKCTAKEINLSEGHIHTIHQGFKQVWTCRTFQMDEETKTFLEEIRKSLGVKDFKDR